MYPRISDLFIDLFGIHLPIPIYSFGAMVAAGVLLAAWLSGIELDRLYADKKLPGIKVRIAENKDKKGRKRSTTKVVSPSGLMGTITIIAVVAGFGGARLFHIFEHIGEFFLDPFSMLFTGGGFSFYGGLVVAGLSIVWFVKKKGMSVPYFADALAPGLMLAYGVGRLGCQLAGDGDWGIVSNIAAKPDWLPLWMWAETYSNNILGQNLAMAPVYPTPLYEFVAGVLLFALLWRLRKHSHSPGWLFSLYMVVNGIERFLIELIRVNVHFNFFGLQATQAEVIAVLLVLGGLYGLFKTSKGQSVSPSSRASITA